MSDLRLAVLGTDEAAAQAAATIALQLRAALELRDRALVAFSGGSTPGPMLDALALWPLPWDRVHVLQVDERIGPDLGDDERNLTMLVRRLVEPAGLPASNLHAWPTDADDVLAASLAVYAAAVGDQPIDVVHLGVGSDGHTASLVPGDHALDVVDSPVAVTAPYAGHRRVTLTFPVLATARSRVVLVAGVGKADALRQLRTGDPSVPVGRIPHARTFVLADTAAADVDPSD